MNTFWRGLRYTRFPLFTSQNRSVVLSNRAWTRASGLALLTAVSGAVLLARQPLLHADDAHMPEPLIPSVKLESVKSQDGTESDWIDPDTSIAFPKSLTVPSKLRFPTLTLLGVGVRTVSFLGIKVYSVGLYADLSNSNLRIPADATPEEKIEHIVSNTACVIRIVPTRSTSYTHLRDAFVRTLNARLSKQLSSGAITQADAEQVGGPLRKFKSLFPNTPLTKHTPLDIFITAPPIQNKSTLSSERALIVRDLGGIESNWVAKEILLSYFEGSGISPQLKNTVFESLQKL